MLLKIYKKIRETPYKTRQKGGKNKVYKEIENKILTETGLKSGPFGELLLREVVENAGFSFDVGEHLNIKSNSKLTKKTVLQARWLRQGVRCIFGVKELSILLQRYSKRETLWFFSKGSTL